MTLLSAEDLNWFNSRLSTHNSQLTNGGVEADIVGGAELVMRRTPSNPLPPPPWNPSYHHRPPMFQPYSSSQNIMAYPASYSNVPPVDGETTKSGQQTRDLEQWMRVVHPEGLTVRERSYKPRSHSTMAPVSANDHSYSLEAMRAAEIQSGYAKRVAGNYPTVNSTGPSRSGSEGIVPPPAPPTPQELPKLVAPIVAAPKKRKAPAPKPTPDTDSPEPESAINHILNPTPFRTPSNIPPNPATSRPVAPLPTPRPKPRATQSPAPPPPKKGALLSAAEKKANHIRSEQKRRAAIRMGYDGLCAVVPSLRVAVEEFEDRVKKASSSTAPANGKKRRSNGGAGVLSGGIDVGGEKIDGRAGPKSEAVVLGKTVEHIRTLLAQREELLLRLSSAYTAAGERSVAVEGGHRIWDDPWVEATPSLAEEVEADVAPPSAPNAA